MVPDPDYFGAAMLTLCISDGENETCGSNNLTVNPVEDAPTASAQSVAGNEDAIQTITLAGSDADGDALTYTLATNPSNGTATLSGNVVTYTPNANYNGSDSFTYTVSDGQLTSEAATVDINITPVNDAPMASAQSASGNEDAAQTITMAGSDADGDPLTYALASNPSNGTATLGGDRVSLNFDGNDDYVGLPLDNGVISSGTITSWVKFNSEIFNNGHTGIYSVGGGAFAGGSVCLLGLHTGVNNNLRFGIYVSGSGWYWVDSGISPSADTWYNVQGSSGEPGRKIYINGEIKPTNPK